MVILEADNRTLIAAAKYTFMATNYSSAITSISVLNATDSAYAANAFVLLGNFGAEDAEILQLTSANNSTGLLSFLTPTLFAHSESTRVTILPYNQIKFFHTDVQTFDIGTATELTGFLNLQSNDWFTTYGDDSNSTGWGWYCFYNSATSTYSQPSNAIPYTGFESDTTENILSDFFSMLNNKELKLITREDALSFASEGYMRMRNKLNLTNAEFTASAIMPLVLVPGQIEYDLPADFDHLVSFVNGPNPGLPGSWGATKMDIEFIPLRKAYTFNGTGPRYYIRGFKIGILPVPSVATTYYYMYLKSATRLTLNTDEVLLPNGGEYVIKDYMLYRAFQKFQNPQYQIYLKSFTDGLNDLIISSVKRDANLDRWDITPEANV